jgi:transcriptional regulator with XRE-family HTH domain
MRLENAVAADVLERILSAYGLTMQKELSDKLGIAKSNVASWLQRGQVPGNVLVQCALDTGADINWLVKGEFANANNNMPSKIIHKPSDSGQSLIKKMLSSGGRPVLQRIMSAYNFTTQKELSDYFGISTGTISTWVRREFFPGDIVIACSIDTGASILWLATGTTLNSATEISDNYFSGLPKIKKYHLEKGVLQYKGATCLDFTILPKVIFSENLILICREHSTLICDTKVEIIHDGIWLLSIDGVYDIYSVSRLPEDTLKIVGSHGEFQCNSSQIKPKGMIVIEIIKR